MFSFQFTFMKEADACRTAALHRYSHDRLLYGFSIESRTVFGRRLAGWLLFVHIRCVWFTLFPQNGFTMWLHGIYRNSTINLNENEKTNQNKVKATATAAAHTWFMNHKCHECYDVTPHASQPPATWHHVIECYWMRASRGNFEFWFARWSSDHNAQRSCERNGHFYAPLQPTHMSHARRKRIITLSDWSTAVR